MNSKNIQIILNIALIIFEIIGLILIIDEMGFKTLQYYTELSNFLLLVSSVFYLFYLISDRELPSWLKSLRFVAVTSTTLTFIVVITVLSWTTTVGLYDLMFKSHMLYHHTLCPILAIILFILFERYTDLKTIEGTYFTIIYGIVFILLNILKVVNGPYPFLMVYNQSVLQTIIWLIVIYAITYATASIIKKGNEKVII